MSVEVVAVRSQCDKLNDDLASQKTELISLHITLEAKTDFVDLLKRCSVVMELHLIKNW